MSTMSTITPLLQEGERRETGRGRKEELYYSSVLIYVKVFDCTRSLRMKGRLLRLVVQSKPLLRVKCEV